MLARCRNLRFQENFRLILTEDRAKNAVAKYLTQYGDSMAAKPKLLWHDCGLLSSDRGFFAIKISNEKKEKGN